MNKDIFRMILLCLLLPLYCGAQKVNNRYPVTAEGKLKYEYMGKLSSGRKLVVNFSQKYGFVDSAMNDVIACIYDSATDFGNGKALVKKGNKYGIIDTMGRELMPCEYDEIRDEYIDGGYYSYDFAGKIGNYAWVKKDSVVGVYTIDAHHFEPATGYWVHSSQHPLANKYMVIYAKGSGGGSGLAFRDGKIALTPRKGQSVGPYMANGRIRISREGKYGFLDTALNVVIPLVYDKTQDFRGGLAAAKLYGKWGYIDTAGNLAVNECYDTANEFRNGIAMVRRDGKYGAINKGGAEVIPCAYDRIVSDAFYYHDQERCNRGVLPVKQGKKWAFIDTSGKLRSGFRYDNVKVGSGGFIVSENDKSGLISCDLKRATSIKYSDISLYFYDGYAVVRTEKWGALDSNYNQILPDTFASEYDIWMHCKKELYRCEQTQYCP